MNGIGVNKFSYTKEEIAQVEKVLGLTFSDTDKELLASDRFSGLVEVADQNAGNMKRQAKIHLFRERNGDVSVACNYRRETLYIPDIIEGHKLSPEEKQLLVDGQTLQLKNSKNQNLYIQVDKDLNAIIVKGDRELGIPEVIGANEKLGYSGYSLTDSEKSCLANKGIIGPRVLCGDMGFFLASFGMTDDLKGHVIYDYQSIPQGQEQEFINKYNHSNDREKETAVKPEQNLSNETNLGGEKVIRDLDNEFTQALNKRDFEKLNQLANEGYKPADTQIQNIESLSGLSEHEKTAVKTIFKIDEETPSLKPDGIKKEELHIKKEDGKTNIQHRQKENENEKGSGRTIEKVGHVLNQAFTQM